ncbi:hypothetical protein NBH08_22690 [Faecalicatena sp. BF-R-105]|nr:hypothetical protein [Faecalicatena sp. BF-R-105]
MARLTLVRRAKQVDRFWAATPPGPPVRGKLCSGHRTTGLSTAISGCGPLPSKRQRSVSGL